MYTSRRSSGRSSRRPSSPTPVAVHREAEDESSDVQREADASHVLLCRLEERDRAVEDARHLAQHVPAEGAAERRAGARGGHGSKGDSYGYAPRGLQVDARR